MLVALSTVLATPLRAEYSAPQAASAPPHGARDGLRAAFGAPAPRAPLSILTGDALTLRMVMQWLISSIRAGWLGGARSLDAPPLSTPAELLLRLCAPLSLPHASPPLILAVLFALGDQRPAVAATLLNRIIHTPGPSGDLWSELLPPNLGRAPGVRLAGSSLPASPAFPPVAIPSLVPRGLPPLPTACLEIAYDTPPATPTKRGRRDEREETGAGAATLVDSAYDGAYLDLSAVASAVDTIPATAPPTTAPLVEGEMLLPASLTPAAGARGVAALGGGSSASSAPATPEKGEAPPAAHHGTAHHDGDAAAPMWPPTTAPTPSPTTSLGGAPPLERDAPATALQLHTPMQLRMLTQARHLRLRLRLLRFRLRRLPRPPPTPAVAHAHAQAEAVQRAHGEIRDASTEAARRYANHAHHVAFTHSTTPFPTVLRTNMRLPPSSLLHLASSRRRRLR